MLTGLPQQKVCKNDPKESHDRLADKELET